MVSTKEECEEASRQLNLIFKWQMDNSNRLAGCYEEEGLVYFNKIINPTDTTPVNGNKERHAICKEYGKFSYLIMLTNYDFY